MHQLRLAAILLKSRSFLLTWQGCFKHQMDQKIIIIGRKAVSYSTGPPQSFLCLSHTYTFPVTCRTLLPAGLGSTECFLQNTSGNVLCSDPSFTSSLSPHPLSTFPNDVTHTWACWGKLTLTALILNSISPSSLSVFINVTFSVWLTFSLSEVSVGLGMGGSEVPDNGGVLCGGSAMTRAVPMQHSRRFVLLTAGWDCESAWQSSAREWHSQRPREMGTFRLFSIPHTVRRSA